MKLSSKDYKNFTKALKKINDKAGSAMEQYINQTINHEMHNKKTLA